MVHDLDGFRSHLERRGAAEGTIGQYLLQVRLPGDPLARLTGPDAKKLAPKYRRLIRAAWRAYARYEKNRELLDALDEVKLPAPARRRPQAPLPPAVYDEVRGRIDRADDLPAAARAALGIAACRGLRLRRDVLHLRRDEIDDALRSGVLAFEAKGGRRLEFGVLRTYRRYLEDLAACFADDPGADEVWELIAKSHRGAGQACAKALKVIAHRSDLRGLSASDVRLHVLRRTYAVTFFEKCGRDPAKLKAHLQWATMETAMGYVDFARREELDEVAEAMFDSDS